MSVTPVRRFSDGGAVGTSIVGFEVTAHWMGEESWDMTMDNVSDNLIGCAVRIDDEDAIEISLQDSDQMTSRGRPRWRWPQGQLRPARKRVTLG